MASLADANRKYFDTISDAYDTKPWFTDLSNRVINELSARLDWLGVPFVDMKPDGQRDGQDEGREVKVLDYACGPGIMSRVFVPHVTLSLGIDVSPNMVSTYNARAQSSNLYPSRMRAVEGDLFDKSNPNPPHLSGPEYHNFDLAAVGFAFHHFEDVMYAARCLKERLRPGGVMVFNDFLSGGDALADEEGRMIEGSEGDHAFHDHGHGHGEGHGHGHDHGHSHAEGHHGHDHNHGHDHHHGHDSKPKDSSSSDGNDSRQKLGSKEMKASVAVPAFSVDGVKEFLSEAGFVDIDVDVVKEKVFIDFHKKMYRTVFFAKGRRPLEEGKKEREREKSEL